jgi:hypothetical protein
MSLLTEIQSRPELQKFIDSGNDSAIVDYFCAKTIDAKGIIASHDIKQYLSLRGLRLVIKEGQSIACKEAELALDDFESFDCSNHLILSKLEGVLTGLEADTLTPDFTNADTQYILSMANAKVSLAESLGLDVNFETVAQALRG